MDTALWFEDERVLVNKKVFKLIYCIKNISTIFSCFLPTRLFSRVTLRTTISTNWELVAPTISAFCTSWWNLGSAINWTVLYIWKLILRKTKISLRRHCAASHPTGQHVFHRQGWVALSAIRQSTRLQNDFSGEVQDIGHHQCGCGQGLKQMRLIQISISMIY